MVDGPPRLVFHDRVRRRAQHLCQWIVFALVAVSCHRKENAAAPEEDQGCLGARCVEEAEAALYYGDDASARPPLEKICEEGDAFGCYRLAELLRNGRGGPTDVPQAVVLYEKSCEGDYGEGCERRAELARDGHGTAEVEFDYAHKACDRGRPLGCTRVAEYYQGDLGKERDALRMLDYNAKGCELGEAIGCTRAGDQLFDPKAAPERLARALAVYKTACKLHDGYGCLKAGIALHEGLGAPQNLEGALYHFVSACELDQKDGCHVAQQLERAKGQPITLELTSAAETLSAGGLEARGLTCQMSAQGTAALTDALTAVARRKRKLDACAKEGAALTVRWTFNKGRIEDARVKGRAPSKVVKCVTTTLRKAFHGGVGSCEAVLLLGDPDGAGKALAAKSAS